MVGSLLVLPNSVNPNSVSPRSVDPKLVNFSRELCGLALIFAVEIPVDYFFLRASNALRGKRFSNQDLHSRKSSTAIGESPNWQPLSYSGIAAIAILTAHEGGASVAALRARRVGLSVCTLGRAIALPSS